MTIAEVKLWGSTIGAASWDPRSNLANFEYHPDFISSGIEIAPLTMPLSRQIYSFPDLSRITFHRLPGLLADSLPDAFGNTLINAWLTRQGRTPETFNPIERLCYIGTRGMGALEFAPSHRQFLENSEPVDVDALVKLASEVLSERHMLQGTFDHELTTDSLQDILRVGTSAGGARAKAVIAWNRNTNEVRSGQIKSGEGFTYWILKFDGVSNSRDKELEDPAGFGLIEYAYYLMARKAGIAMEESRLLKENDRSHFMTKRFDRTDSGQKIHMQSLCAMEHFDFNRAGENSYEQALITIRKLDMPMSEVEEQFRRMAFNVVARNQDDHVKNIAFLMNRAGVWSLSPAFDLTYSYNPQGYWTRQHQMSLNGKRNDFTIEDFKACAKSISMKRGRAEEIVGQVQEAVSQWQQIADRSGVPPFIADGIAKTHRIGILK